MHAILNLCERVWSTHFSSISSCSSAKTYSNSKGEGHSLKQYFGEHESENTQELIHATHETKLIIYASVNLPGHDNQILYFDLVYWFTINPRFLSIWLWRDGFDLFRWVLGLENVTSSPLKHFDNYYTVTYCVCHASCSPSLPVFTPL